MVEPPPHGARTTKPPSVPSSRMRQLAGLGRREGLQQVRPVLAGRRSGELGHVGQVRRREWPDPRVDRLVTQPGRLQDPIPGLDLESDLLVERAARVGRYQQQRPAAGRLGGVDRRLGQRHPDTASPPRRLDPDRADPADAAVDAQHAGPDDLAVRLGDERVRLRVPRREVEIRPAIAPVRTDERGDDRLDVGWCHRADAWQRHEPIVAVSSAIIGRMAALSRTDVEHVAHLARLGLTDEELTRLEAELNHILDQYAILAELPTDDIPPTAQTIELENILREDVVKPSLSVEAVLANAPARDGDFIVVPAILDER